MAHQVDVIDEDSKLDDETAERLQVAFDFLSNIQVDCGPGWFVLLYFNTDFKFLV